MLALIFTLWALWWPILSHSHAIVCPAGAACPEGLAKLVVTEGKEEWKCTGFLISDTVMATNRHCLPEACTACGKTMRVYFAAAANHPAETIACAKILSASERPGAANVAGLDFAFFSLEKSAGRSPFRVSHEGVKKGDKLTLWRVDGLVRSFVKKEECGVEYESLLFPFARGGDFPVVTLEGCRAEHGNSGSPLLNPEGAVVALLEGMNNEKNVSFYRKKFGAAKVENILKASNFACVETPLGAGCQKSAACRETRAERDFLPAGNEILSAAARKKLDPKTSERAGLRMGDALLFAAEYTPDALRPNRLFAAPGPVCITNKENLVKHRRR